METITYEWHSNCQIHCVGREAPLTLKIRRTIKSRNTTLIVAGRIDSEQLPELEELVRSEGSRQVAFDLKEVTLVGREVVRFLVQCETRGVRLVNCPAYIREWMDRETKSP